MSVAHVEALVEGGPSRPTSSRSMAARAASAASSAAPNGSADNRQADFRALVVGVTSPGTTTGLADAEAFAARLSDDGVDTLCCLNPTLAELELALRRFCDLARPINGVQAPGGAPSPGSKKDVGLFYFSGFCLELDGKAYALPAGFVLPEKIATGSMGTRVLWQTLTQICMPLETIFERISAAGFDVPIVCLDSSRPLPPDLTPHDRYFEGRPGAPGTLSQAALAAPALSGKSGAVVAAAAGPHQVVGNRAVEWGDNSHGAFIAALLTAFMDARNVGQALEQTKQFMPVLMCGVQEGYVAFSGGARSALSKRAVFTQAAAPTPVPPAEASAGGWARGQPGEERGLGARASFGGGAGREASARRDSLQQQEEAAWPPPHGQVAPGDSPLAGRVRMSVSDTAEPALTPPRMLKKRPSLITIVPSATPAGAGEDNEIARIRKSIAMGKFRRAARVVAAAETLAHESHTHHEVQEAERRRASDTSHGGGALGTFRRGAKVAAIVGQLASQATASAANDHPGSRSPLHLAVGGAASSGSTAGGAAGGAAERPRPARNASHTSLSGERSGGFGGGHGGGGGGGFGGSGEGFPVTPATQAHYFLPDMPMGYARGDGSGDEDDGAERPLPYARSEISTAGNGHDDPARMGPAAGAATRRSRLTGPADALQSGVAAIVRAMQGNLQDVEVQLQGCAALWNVTSGGAAAEVRQRAAALGVPALAAAMEAHQGSADLQAQACGALWNVMCNASEAEKNAAGACALRHVVEAMRAHLLARNVQLQAAGALRSLTLTLDNKVAAAQLGAFDALLAAAREHAAFAPVVAQAAAALRNLTTVAETRELAVERGALPALVGALREHALSTEVVQQAAAALVTLAGRDSHRLAVAELGGLSAVLELLRQHDRHEDVVRQALRCLAQLTSADGPDEAAAAAGGVALVSAALASHRAPDALRYGCRCLANMAPFAGAHHAQEGLLAVMDALACCPEDAALQAQGCSAIWSFVCAGPEARSLVASLNVVEAVAGSMRRHKEDPEVQTQCCGVVAALTPDAEARGQIVAHGGVALIVDAMRWNPGSAEVQKTGCAALWGLTSRADTKAQADAAGAAQVVAAALSRFPEDADLAAQACGALGSIAASADEAVVARAAAHGLSEVVAAMRTHASSKEVLRIACRALRNMSQSDRPEAQAGAAQALQAVLHTMRAASRSAELQARELEGCKALAGLTHSPASREEALHIGAAEAVADCMINNSEVPEVQKYGCRALQNVMLASAQAPAKSRVAVQLALQAVCAALQTHENLCDVVVEALGALWSITLDRQSVTPAAQEGALDLIVEAMNLHAGSPEALRIGCGALRNLVVGLDYAQVELTDENARGVIAAVVLAMQSLPEDTRTQKHGFQTLSQLTRGGEEEDGGEFEGVEEAAGGRGGREMSAAGTPGVRRLRDSSFGSLSGARRAEGEPVNEQSTEEVAGLSRTKFTF